MQRFFQGLRMLPQQQGTVQKAIRVDHAGEYAAVRIYAGQMAALKGRPVYAVLEKFAAQEKEHLREMERLVAKHEVLPTIFTPMYYFVGYALGRSTAFFGNKTAMACTIAVEELIGNHYNDQIKKFIEEDPVGHSELLEKLSKLRDDELEHQDVAIEHHGLEAPFYTGMKWVIQAGCRSAMFVSSHI